MIIVFVGPPGVGKGTQSKRLVSHFQLVHISTGEMLRKAIGEGTRVGVEARDYIDHGRLVPDDLIVELVGKRFETFPSEQGCLMDGFPRTITQARSLDGLLEKLGRRVDVVIELVADRDEIRRRLLDRARLEGRSDDSPETITARLEIFDRQTAPLIDFYRKCGSLRQVNGMGTPDEVFNRILDSIRS